MSSISLLLKILFFLTTALFSGINVHGQRFSLRRRSYPNHGLVLREDIGDTNLVLTSNVSLDCISFEGCCSSGLRGEYYFPGGTNIVPNRDGVGTNGYYRNRDSNRVILNRQSPSGTTTGIFECRIRTDSSQTEYQIFYIGVYDDGAGSPTISGMYFNSESSTLTCTSIGGPATTVVWRQNCIILQQNGSNYVQSQVVTSTLTATYENTLVVNSTDSDGVYTCSVTNSQGYVNSAMGIGTVYSSSLPITVSITLPSVTPMAGQSFTLTCQATTALINPTYQWFDDSGRMIGNVSTLTLNPLLESSTGEYSCQVTAGSGANKRFGCGVSRVIVQAPSLTVTVSNTANAVAALSHTLSCSATGTSLETATVMYTWRLNNAVLQGPSTSNLYNIATVQVSNAGEVYTCEVTVTAAYWDVSGSFGDSASETLSVTIPTPDVQFTRLRLGSLYVGLPFSWRCDVEIPGKQLIGVTAEVEWRKTEGAVITSDSRITVGVTIVNSPGRDYQKTLMFSPLSAGDSGSYSCLANIMPAVSNSFVTNGMGTGSDSLTVADTTLDLQNIGRSAVPPRVLDLPNYNGFSLTCTATSRAVNMDVAVSKTITWMRSVDGGNLQLLTDSDVSSGEYIMISSTDLEMATAMSTLEVNTTVPESHVYTCIANLSITPAPDVIQEQVMTTIDVQGAVSPNPPVGLVTSGVTHNSATIRWTVTSLSYGPEMYVVQYGTDMNTLDQTSSMETSGSDITLTNFSLGIRLTGLQLMTTYFYRLIAMNGGSRMTPSETIGTFNTTALAPEPPRMLEGVSSTNPADPPSLSFNWLAPNVTNGDILDYTLTCVSEGITTPPSVTSNTTSANISNLENGVQYCCTVTARNAQTNSIPDAAQCISTIEIAPTGEPQEFMARFTESRNVTFTWLLPVLAERNGIITSYNLTCVNTTTGREAFLTRVYPVAESNNYPLTGFKPDTGYICRVFAINSQGRGRTANLSLTTQPDEPDGPPQNINFTLVAGSPSEVQFNFDPPREDLQNGLITAYRISCVDRDGTRAAISMTYLSSLSRPYTLSSLIPATLYDCSLSARTSPGFGIEDTVEVLTMPDKLTMISITPDKRSLLVMWTYTNPMLSEGAVISGYRVYLNGQRVGELTSSTMNQFNITSLSPSTVYTVEVSAFNTRGNGMKQEGPRSDPQVERTLEDVPDAPLCPDRWQSAALTRLEASWSSPLVAIGNITAYYVQLLNYRSDQVIQSGSLSDLSSLRLTLDDLTLAKGVPYDVRVFAENGAGNGSFCTITDFGDEGTPPSNILNDLVSSYVTGDSSSVLLTWTVLPLDQIKGFITLSITFGPLVSRVTRKRQTSGESTECSQSPCLVSYDKGRVRISGLDSQQDHFIFVIPENEEREVGTKSALRIDARTQSPAIKSSLNNAAVAGISSAVLLVIGLLLFLSVIVFVVQRTKYKNSKSEKDEIMTTQCEAYEAIKLKEKPGPKAGQTSATTTFSSEQAEIITTQCEAYEVLKLKKQPRRAGQTTTEVIVPDVTYEEVGEGLSHWNGRGLEVGATPQLEQATQHVYDNVTHGMKKNLSPAHQGAAEPRIMTDHDIV